MIRGAVLCSGDGGQLQAILDSIYFKEITNFELVAVISTSSEAYALKRAASANVPSYVVDPDLFPNSTSHSIAVATKLKDMDIDLVVLADYAVSLGVIPFQFKGQIIGSLPCLYPAFEDYSPNDICEAVLNRGIKITGATAYFADSDGRVGMIIDQKAIEVLSNDTPNTLRNRIMEECEWKILPRAVSMYCSGRIKNKFGSSVKNSSSDKK